ncbi:MAG TPA: HNH endonuclease [Silvibacterium sp.]|nr:HNH endonuclease [Silvibacterium sp.]
MVHRTDKRNRLFGDLAADYKKHCAAKSEATVACPLCLTEYNLANVAELTREHIVPSKLGGRSETLTCRKCNNTQGSYLDSHLISLMKSLDAIEGAGPIETSVIDGKGKITAELLLRAGTPDEPNTIQIVGQASNMDAVQNLRNSMRDGETLELRMNFPFIPERYVRAAFRAAFLSVFKVEGYEYALSLGAEHVRTMLGTGSPVLKNVVMEAFPERDPATDLLVMPANFSDFGEYYAVLLRLQTKRTRYLSVFLPGKHGRDWTALEALYHHAPRLRLETTPDGWDSKLYIRLGYNPMAQFRKGLQDRFTPTPRREPQR